ncbi:hypothetical protein MKW98_008110 [Papaver atlanticum]|uniref:Calponin-homology (CH) domain-containing protein n=1 Tax=Papaver atlanticum TaxID=357466 RepID=A0AAD4S7M4_9MAGN|nr:hypothetical protein MKW98_008110 [Papaver atlanticum]
MLRVLGSEEIDILIDFKFGHWRKTISAGVFQECYICASFKDSVMNSESRYGDLVNVKPTMGINEGKRRAEIVEWLHEMVPDSRLPLEASEEDLREYLINGAVFDSILNRLSLESVDEVDNSNFSSESHLESVSRFLEAVYEMGLPKFEVQDLEQGSMKPVLECLWAVKEKFSLTPGEVTRSSSIRSPNNGRRSWSLSGAEFDGSLDISPPGHSSLVSTDERRKNTQDSKFKRVLRSHVASEPSAALIHHVGHKFHEVF